MSLSWLGREVSRMARNSRIRRTFTPQFKKEAVALLKQGRSATTLHRASASRAVFSSAGRSSSSRSDCPRCSRALAAVLRSRGGGGAPQEAAPCDRGARHPEKSAGLLRGRRELRFRFIDAHRGELRIGTMCEVLGVSRSGYYVWRSRPR